ncbi:ABC transporter permease [Mesobacterium sp. TK19101]|uniref:ABC transporter permease n=1 Tax=Mesobacterium hydrothermale TaxID=3111907 RepID=A0ABU6HFA9_9RHOB|nr:ABC transporter permease [Mesobacterium sp. TK19101]MEC3860802.1 ABC transporter permease [Mesobacterium sp. TK19101]
MSDASTKENSGPMLAADGRPLKSSLARALRMQKLRALALVAPLLLFVLATFIMPIADMLFRSVENQIVSETMPRTVVSLKDWDPEKSALPSEAVFEDAYYDLFIASERKTVTRLGSRLNYEMTGASSLFRKSGRRLDDIGEVYQKQFKKIDKDWDKAEPWAAMMGDPAWISAQEAWSKGDGAQPVFKLRDGVAAALPRTAAAYRQFAIYQQTEDNKSPLKEEPWSLVHTALYQDLSSQNVGSYTGPGADRLQVLADAVKSPDFKTISFVDGFADVDEDWVKPDIWQTIKAFSPTYTSGYFLNAVDMKMTPEGAELRDEKERLYIFLFKRTIFMSMVITISCILLAYPIAYLLSNLPARTANLLMILVLLPFWTSLLVRTSAWKVMLQQQGVINDVLVWLGLVADDGRLVMINNQLGTIIAMTHILLPFMILPMYSVMSTIPPSYVRAAKSLGATNWTTFWRVYFPQSVPGIGAGSILVFILSIGYYITPEIVGGTTGTFISNRIAYHISSSLNWGLAAALGTILLAVVLLLYWAYDRIVGIDNVKLG